MIDPRVQTLAKNLVEYSTKVGKGDKVLIEATDIDSPLVTSLIKEVYAKGGFPFVALYDSKVQRAMLSGVSQEYCEALAKYNATRMKEMNCYIGIRGADNSFETSDVPSDKLNLYSKFYSHPVHHELRVQKTRWVILRYPSPSFAQANGTSTDAFEDYFFNVCNLNYAKMDKAMDSLVALFAKTDKVHIKSLGTDLKFSIKGIPSVKCSGERNIPDGEVYTAPVKNSVNGTIAYNAPSTFNGTKYENITLTFKDGKIVNATSNHTEQINTIFDMDAGSRYVGEFAIGVNPFINKACGDILFDEKIAGSFHFTPGACYTEASNGNESALHWDLVLIQTPEMGGGEIYFDDKLIRKDGRFVVKELECLNPENLK